MKARSSIDKNPVLYGFGYWPKAAWRRDFRRWLIYLMLKITIVVIVVGVCHVIKVSRYSFVRDLAKTIEIAVLENGK